MKFVLQLVRPVVAQPEGMLEQLLFRKQMSLTLQQNFAVHQVHWAYQVRRITKQRRPPALYGSPPYLVRCGVDLYLSHQCSQLALRNRYRQVEFEFEPLGSRMG